MSVSSLIVEVQSGEDEAVLHSLASLHNVSVYGLLEHRIVAVVEGVDMKAVDRTIQQITAMENVLGAYPVYAVAHD